MYSKKLKSRYIISNCSTILILIISLLLGYFNLENLINSEDGVSNLIGVLGLQVLPFIVISIIIQILIMILAFTNKQSKQVLNIISLIFEIIYFIFVNLTCVPFVFLNFAFLNNLLGYLVFIGFEILNTYIIVLLIKMIIQTRKGSENNE